MAKSCKKGTGEKMTSFFIGGVPAPKGSKNGFIRGGKVVLVESSKKEKPWREAVARIAGENIDEPKEGPIRLVLEFIMPRTKAMGNKVAQPMTQKPDLDKLIRSTCDGLTGPGYVDDSQVVSVLAVKRRAAPGEETGAAVTLESMEEKYDNVTAIAA